MMIIPLSVVSNDFFNLFEKRFYTHSFIHLIDQLGFIGKYHRKYTDVTTYHCNAIIFEYCIEAVGVQNLQKKKINILNKNNLFYHFSFQIKFQVKCCNDVIKRKDYLC